MASKTEWLGYLVLLIFGVNSVAAAAGLPAIGAVRVEAATGDAPVSIPTGSGSVSDPDDAFPLVEHILGDLPADWKSAEDVVKGCESEAVQGDARTVQTRMNDCLLRHAVTVTRRIGDTSISVTYYPPKTTAYLPAGWETELNLPEGVTTGPYYGEIVGDRIQAFSLSESYRLEMRNSYGCSVLGIHHADKPWDGPIGCTSDKILPPVPGGLDVSRSSFWLLMEMDVLAEATVQLRKFQQQVAIEACEGVESSPACSGNYWTQIPAQGPAEYEAGLLQQYSESEELQKSTEKTGYVWSKESAIATCEGFWLMYVAPFGCRFVRENFKTRILAWDIPPTATAPTGGSGEVTVGIQQSVLWDVNTDPFGVASEKHIEPAWYPCHKWCTSLGKYGGCIGNIVWKCDTDENAPPDMPGLVEDSKVNGWNPPGSVIEITSTFTTVIHRYHMSMYGQPTLMEGRWDKHVTWNPAASPEHLDTLFEPMTTDEWSTIYSKMQSLSLVDRVIFVFYVNRLNGYCDSTCMSQFTATAEALGSEDTLKEDAEGFTQGFFNFAGRFCGRLHGCGFASDILPAECASDTSSVKCLSSGTPTCPFSCPGSGSLRLGTGNGACAVAGMQSAASRMRSGEILRGSWVNDCQPYNYVPGDPVAPLCGTDNYACYNPLPSTIAQQYYRQPAGTRPAPASHGSIEPGISAERGAEMQGIHATTGTGVSYGYHSLLSLIYGGNECGYETLGQCVIMYHPCVDNVCQVTVRCGVQIALLNILDTAYVEAPALMTLPTGATASLWIHDLWILAAVLSVAFILVGRRRRHQL